MSRALLISTLAALCWCNAARAQDEPELPAPDDSPVPAERARAPKPAPSPAAEPVPVRTPEPEPASPPPAPEPALAEQPEPPPTPPPRQRFEGEISTEGAPAYADEQDDPEDDSARDDEPHGDGGGGFTMPAFSIRIDPFNWLLEGRLGLELEVVAWKFISVELVPVFVANTEPPSFNYGGRSDPVSQHSNGLGPISGASLGAGFWFSGTPLQGYVLRALITNYGYTYEARDGDGVFDSVSHTERRLVVLIGSQSRFGAFTIGGGIGLGYELNQQQRCIVNRGTARVDVATSDCPDEDEMQIKLDRFGSSIDDLNGSFHPVYLVGRFSLGVSFD